ncbi:hypothetical protein Poli38472_007850 [Pythium oligandrum]|uniref:Diacylglycerol O-acyltransferase n=1 Tax=Pythium oligandrum TaxID=41045 RepID=A0A8K1CSK8_PYTOL|nr:hypothetical protein Poli38472_007850 [Pythium oligandrum]|eukprot:TMW68178.1 hypothetical protein Poli38472_007850 [Pythium oligandrum]
MSLSFELNATTIAAALVVTLLLFVLQSSRRRQLKRSPDSPRQLHRRMSNIGLTTLVSEIETNLSIPVSVITVDGKVTTEEFTTRLQERMATDPFFTRFRSLVVGEAKTFVELPEFDAAQQIKSHVLEPEQSPIAFVETLVNMPMDFSKPLWEMHVLVDPANDHVTHFAWKVHHCLGDGASLSMAMIRLSDNKDQVDQMLQKMREAKKAEKKPKKPLGTKAKEFAGFCVLFLWSAAVITRKLALLFLRPEPKTLFKRPGGTRKRLSYQMLYSVNATKAVGKHYKATVNDVMLNCVAGAMRKALLEANEPIAPNLVVRAAIPVDMRGTTEEIKATANKFSSLVIDFPIGVADTGKRLRLIQKSMNEAKNSLEKVFTYTSSHIVAQLPAWLIKHAIQFTTSRLSVAISNVRMSSMQLSLCDKPMTSFFGFVPPPPTVNLGVAVLSVGDALGLNVLVDPHVGVDAKKFLEYAKEEFDALEALSKQEIAAETKASEKKEQ